jgi:hypothetical protein
VTHIKILPLVNVKRGKKDENKTRSAFGCRLVGHTPSVTQFDISFLTKKYLRIKASASVFICTTRTRKDKKKKGNKIPE